MSNTRKRLEQRRTYNREHPADRMPPRRLSVSKRRDDVLVEVHVHNQLPPPTVIAAVEQTAPPAGEWPRPAFSGRLYSWREHYHPLFEKIVPMLTEKQARRRRMMARVARITFWGAVLAGLTTLGCNYL